MDVIMVSNSQTHAARKSQLMSRASLSPRSQSCSRPLSHRSKNKFQGWVLAGQEHTSGSVASWCLAGVSPRPALLLLQTAWRSGSTLGRTRPSKTCSKPGTGFICSCVWSESQGCPLQVSKGLLDKARSTNLVHTYYNRSRVYSWVRCLPMSGFLDCLFFFIGLFVLGFFFFLWLFLAVLCSMQDLSSPCLLQWKHRFLTTGPPGKSHPRQSVGLLCSFHHPRLWLNTQNIPHVWASLLFPSSCSLV